MNNLLGSDIKLMRSRYDEALKLQGIPAKYQFPTRAQSNVQGESLVDFFSIPENTHVFFDGNPKVKTIKRYGWVVENTDELPMLVHCSFNLQNLQRDCLFTFSGLYTGLQDRVFRVLDLTYDIQAPDHIVCKVVPVYNKEEAAGRTKKEVAQKFNKSHTFMKNNENYRGEYVGSQNGDE